MSGQLKRKWREPALIFAQRNAVDPDGRGRHRSFKVKENTLAFQGPRRFEASAVSRNKLVGLVVEAMPWQEHVGVRNDSLLESRIIKFDCFGSLHLARGIAPATIDRYVDAPGSERFQGKRWHTKERSGSEKSATCL